jgi:uncharacterized protein
MVKDPDFAMQTNRILLICIAAPCWFPAYAGAASFNCAKAQTPNENLICSDRQLSVMDDDLAALYRAAKAVAPDAVGFKRETNVEWRHRQDCVDRDCLIAWYQRRTAQLATELNHAQRAQTPSTPVGKGWLRLLGQISRRDKWIRVSG